MEWHLTFQRACPFALHLFLLAPLLYGVALLPECCKAIAGGRERPRAWFIFRGFLTIVISAPTLVCFLQYASYSRNTGYSLLEDSRWFRGQGPRELMDGRFLGYSLWQWVGLPRPTNDTTVLHPAFAAAGAGAPLAITAGLACFVAACRRKRSKWLCACGYDLSGAPHVRCSECGRIPKNVVA